MAKIAIPTTAYLWVVRPDKRKEGYSHTDAKAKFGDDVFDKIEAKGKHEQKRMLLCNQHPGMKCLGSSGSPEVFRYGLHEWRDVRVDTSQYYPYGWHVVAPGETLQTFFWPFVFKDDPGLGRMPFPVVKIEDFGRTEIKHKVTFKDMEAVWSEEFQNG